jgi:hypothetical protein
MGERQNGPFQLSLNSSLKVDFQGSRVTSDGGLILVRELDERLGFGDLVARHPALEARLDTEFRGARVYVTGCTKTENGNSG